MIKHLEFTSKWLSEFGAWISMGLLVYIVVHILIEIFLRTVMDASTYSLDEFVGYAVGAMTFLSLGTTFRERKLIRVSILNSMTHGVSQKIIEIVCIALTFCISLFLARYIWRTLARDWDRGTVSPTLTETPIWIIDGLLFSGLSIFLFQLVVSAIVVINSGVKEDDEMTFE